MMLNLSREIPCGYSDGELKGKTEGDGGWESEQILRDRRKEKKKDKKGFLPHPNQCRFIFCCSDWRVSPGPAREIEQR